MSRNYSRHLDQVPSADSHHLLPMPPAIFPHGQFHSSPHLPMVPEVGYGAGRYVTKLPGSPLARSQSVNDATSDVSAPRKTVWRTKLSKLKASFRFGSIKNRFKFKKDAVNTPTETRRPIVISAPTEFRLVRTGSAVPVRTIPLETAQQMMAQGQL